MGLGGLTLIHTLLLSYLSRALMGQWSRILVIAYQRECIRLAPNIYRPDHFELYADR